MNAFARAQQRFDDMEPADDGRADYINSMSEQLLNADDCRLVSWPAFSESAGELLGDHSEKVVQLVLASFRGKTELADKLTKQLGEKLTELAERMVTERIGK